MTKEEKVEKIEVESLENPASTKWLETIEDIEIETLPTSEEISQYWLSENTLDANIALRNLDLTSKSVYKSVSLVAWNNYIEFWFTPKIILCNTAWPDWTSYWTAQISWWNITQASNINWKNFNGTSYDFIFERRAWYIFFVWGATEYRGAITAYNSKWLTINTTRAITIDIIAFN